MTAPPDDTTTDLHAVIAALRAERDAALSERAVLAETLAQRSSEYGERIEYQAATTDVLKAMSASPGDPQPVFDLITKRALALCNGLVTGLFTLEGELIQIRSAAGLDEEGFREYRALFPMRPNISSTAARAILERRIIHVRDIEHDPDMSPTIRRQRWKAALTVPIMRNGLALGSISLGAAETGGFTDGQVELVKTFAEQAVIAITSAETYRALQTRTSDLQETLEYQTAISDVLKVISRSTFDLQPVLDTVAETAAKLCDADQAAFYQCEHGLVRLVSSFGFSQEYVKNARDLGAFPIDRSPQNVGPRAIRERRTVHIHDVAAVPGYGEASVRFGRQRTSLGVPLMREDEALGSIVLARQRVEPFTERQIGLVSTFANQAVIAIENTRLITEQREALEQQTATAEVLQVINANPGNLAPVFETILEKAHNLCNVAVGSLSVYVAGLVHTAATRGFSDEYETLLRRPYPAIGAHLALLRGGSSRQTPDFRMVPVSPEMASSLDHLERMHLRTGLWVPMRKDGTALGCISLYRDKVQSFSEKEITLLENFAAQAVIAMENARLLNEQREALEQQTATAEVLQVINQSPGNLEPVFETLLDRAMRLCGASFGELQLFDGERLRQAAFNGVPAPLADFRRRSIGIPTPGPTTRRMREGANVLHSADIMAEDAYREGDPHRRALVDLGGARTVLAVALRNDDKLLGAINIYRQEVRPFSDRQVTLLQNFAAQAVIAIENARLLTEQREALEQQTAMAEVLQVINASPGDLMPVFDAILEKAMRLCGAAIGGIYGYDGQWFHPVALRGVTPAFATFSAGHPVPSGPSSAPMRILKTKRPAQVPDLADGSDYTRGMVELGGIRSLLDVPLLKEDALLGFIAIYREQAGAFSDKEIALLENFAGQAVIAMENARLLTEQREALEQQTATAEVLQVINASPGDLMPVFDTILAKALRLCEAVSGSLVTYDGRYFQIVATQGLSAGLAKASRERGPLLPSKSIAYDQIVRGADIVHIPDIMALGVPFPSSPNIDQDGARTTLFVALRGDDALFGAFVIFRKEVRLFSDKQIALLKNFAAQAVIAMENARLLDEIRQRQEELRITFENMGDGVALFDATRHLVASNRRFQDMLDVPDDVISARPAFADYIRYLADRGEYGPDAEEHVQRLLSVGGQPAAFERTRPNGRIVEVRSNPVPSGGFVVIYSDITERKRSEEEIRAARDAAEEASRTIEAAYRDLKAAQANLIQAEKMASLGQLTAGIAHEIKNPLNFVNNFAALSVDLLGELKETAAPGFALLTEERRAEVADVSAMLTNNLEKIAEHGKRADDIVKAMLEHSRGSSGERRKVEINTLADEALNLAYHGARAQDQSFNITLERDFAVGIAPIELAPQDMTRVFLNLFSNGFYAVTRRAREGRDAQFVPTLKVTTRDAGEAVEIRVRDNGVGIPADIRDKLFQPFFTTKPTGEGTGLGLSITYDIVTQQHGGYIGVASKVGEYSEFVIRLPRKP